MLSRVALRSRPVTQAALARTTPATIMSSRRMYATSKPDDAKADKVKSITVFGAGLMGSGIVQVAATSGYKVVMTDVTERKRNGMNIIHKSLARVAKKMAPKAEKSEEDWKQQVLERITTSQDPAEAVQNADLVIEAIIENLKIKQDLFAFLDSKANKDCIFASNTSALSVAEISSKCSEDRRTRFAGVHFMQPVPAMRLVEIIKAPKTDPEIIEILLAITARMGKSPVNCLDTPGFIVNRLLIPYLMESVRMLERGEATAEDIDQAMELGTGHPS
ncbi:hypothetical protein FFLO_04215 [Filobasidium floriforme]|uniref:3-hydroxyacyl-CoA dehydrogenase n=1 Tax=Filobasidium floriforme TaxID=5210 RepID=A0A8K0NQ24_9TREE|nr:hypothetical protein FFLO_04215 [Filobasidium floriforme]